MKALNGINNRKMGFKLLGSFLVLIIFLGGLVFGISFYQYAKITASLSEIAENQSNIEQLFLSTMEHFWYQFALAIFLSILLSIFLGWLLSRSITRPLQQLNEAVGQMAKGDLLRESDANEREELLMRKDEIGDIARSFTDLIQYLQNFGLAANALADGNLAFQLELASQEDELGSDMQTMFAKLKTSLAKVSNNVHTIDSFSDEMAQIASQSQAAAGLISSTMDEVASGITEQVVSVQDAFAAIQKSQIAIGDIVTGFEQQMMAVDQGASLSHNLTESIGVLTGDIHSVAKETDEASNVAKNGVEKIGTTLKNIEGIQSLVESSQEKVAAMQAQTGQIGRIVETIEDIAAQTNLLAINATIEAAHAEADSKTLTESMLEQFMLGACEMIAGILNCTMDIPPSYWHELGRMAGIDQILITDDDGVITIGNDPVLMGFRFPEDNPQTAEFRQLIGQENGRVCQAAQMRAADKQMFKYAGVSRKDQPGIVQVGYNMNSLALFNFQIGGFAVVAKEVYDLAESAKTATKEIRALLSSIQNAANEANEVMKDSAASVRDSLAEAAFTGENLNEIIKAFEHVSKQTKGVAAATEEMQTTSAEFHTAIQAIQDVVESNQRVIDAMRQHTDEMAGSIDRIKNISEENNAATEEVTASTKELEEQITGVSQTAEKLSEMANTLSEIVAQFNLDEQHEQNTA